ncbi:Ctr copper transporter [Mycena rebaudengoi]|nr:Ctr copper transporter [Mycena rebaudengoi]
MDSMNMNMTDSGTSNSTTESMGPMPGMAMKTYLHFTPGDTLIFHTIVPTSPGGIVGACIILFLLSVADHYLRSVCRGIEARFVQRAKKLATSYHFVDHTESGKSAQVSEGGSSTELVVGSPKFILSHEVTRGALAGILSAVHYFLMLIVMTFNAAFIISVILGVAVGEFAFGRLNRH